MTKKRKNDRWEYANVRGDIARDTAMMQVDIENLGLDGWELVSVTQILREDNLFTTFWFKRRL